MLSDSDISKYLGKYIGIYPIIEKNFEGSCIELTASELAWSLSTKQRVAHDGHITIPKHDSVLIITQETVYLDKRFAGYCISKVSMPSFGIVSTSAPVKPNWIGKLLITVHNVSNNDYILEVGKEFAILTIHKLRNKSKKIPPRPNARTDLLSRHGIQLSAQDLDILNSQADGDPRILFKLIKRDPVYKEFRINTMFGQHLVQICIYALVFGTIYVIFKELLGVTFIESVLSGIISTFIYEKIKNRR